MSSTIVLKFDDNSCKVFVVSKKRKIIGSSVFNGKNRESFKEELIEELRRVSKEENINDVVVITSFRFCNAGILHLPVTELLDIDSMLNYELEKLLPLPVTDYKIAFDVIEKKRHNSSIIYCAIPKHEVEFYRELIKQAQLNLTSLRISFFELYRAFLLKKNSTMENFIFIVNENGRFCFACIRDGKFDEIKHTKNIKQLSHEIEDAFTTGIKDIYGINLDVLKIDEFKLQPIDIDDNELIASINCKKKPFIDFLTEKHVQNRKGLYKTTLLLAFLALLLFISSYLIPYYLDLKELNRINSEINKIKSTAADVINMSKQLQTYRDMLREYRRINRKALFPIESLLILTEKVPENTWLYNFKYEKNIIEIQGFSDSATDLIKPLEDNKMFKNVRFVSPIITRNNKDRFKIRMELE